MNPQTRILYQLSACLFFIATCPSVFATDLWLFSGSHITNESTSFGFGAYIPLGSLKPESQIFKNKFLKANVTKFNYRSKDFQSSGQSESIGYGLSGELTPNISGSADINIEHRHLISSSPADNIRSEWHGRVNFSVKQDAHNGHVYELSVSVAPSLRSYWISTQYMTSIGKSGWLLGPQLSTSGERNYHQTALAMQIVSPLFGGRVSFSSSLGTSYSPTALNKKGTFLGVFINYGF